MKRYLFFFNLLISSVVCISQDTVHYGDSVYFFNPRCGEEWTSCDIGRSNYAVTYYRKYFSADTFMVYGIAMTAILSGQYDTIAIGFARRNVDGTFEHIKIDTLRDLTPRKTSFHYESSYNASVVPCYEFYYDKTLFPLIDTLYVFVHQSRLGGTGDFMPIFLFGPNNDSSEYPGCPNETYAVNERSHEFWGRESIYGFLFPILTPDRPYAIPVTGLRRTGQGPDNATFVWDDMQVREWYNTTDSSAYELRLQQGDSTLRTMATGDTALRLDALTPGVLYSASVRQTLHHTCLHHADSTLYGPWSTPIYFRLTGTVDIDDPAADGHAPLRLYPNPAAAEATLEADAALLPATLVITDTQGRPCHTQPLTTPTCRIPLATLPAGHYTVTLHTPSRHPSIPLIIQH